MNLKQKYDKQLEKLEDLWVKYHIQFCVFLGVISGLIYFFGYIVNMKNVVSNAINFASIVIGVTGVFLTLIVTLQESPVFERLRSFFPNIQTKLYRTLQWQINYGLILVMQSIIAISLPEIPNKLLSSIGVAIWFTFFWLVSLGSFYCVKLVTDLVVKNFNIPTKNKRI